MDIWGLESIQSDKIALIDEDREITYAELIESAKRYTKKIRKRSLVFIIVENTHTSIEAYVGTILSDSVPLLLHNNMDLDKFAKLIELYNPSYIFTFNGTYKILPNYKELDVFDGYILWERNTSLIQTYSINDDLALLLSTSGSTGSPKCVRISYENLIENTKAIIKYLEINDSERAITTLPMDYTYGLSVINTHLMAGASIVLYKESIIKKNFWINIKRHNCTTFGGVPFTYELIAKFNLMRYSENLHYITQAGGKLHKKHAEIIMKECKQRGIKFIIMYGQTEATARMSYLPWECAEHKIGSIGIPIPGGSFEIIDEEGKVVNENIEGELVYRGKNVAMGYAIDCFDLSKGDEVRGILHTGDIAIRDKDGFYYITGRKSRFLKIYGNRVSLDEIEERLNNEGIECACVGQDNLIVPVIVEAEFEGKTKDIIRQYGIERNCIKICVVNELPYQPSGKIDYSYLKKFILKG